MSADSDRLDWLLEHIGTRNVDSGNPIAEVRDLIETVKGEAAAMAVDELLNDIAAGSTHTTLSELAARQYEQVERIWPTPGGQDAAQRQGLALVEEVGEIARALLKRSHAGRSLAGMHKGWTVAQWTANVHEEIGQALGVLLGLAHLEGVDLDEVMARTLAELEARPSIIWGRCTPGLCDLDRGHNGPHMYLEVGA